MADQIATSQEERRRRTSGSKEVRGSESDADGSPIVASLIGMLAGLGMLVLMTAALTAGGLVFNLELGLVITGDVRVGSIIGLAIAAIVIIASTLIGGFAAGRMARNRGFVAGIGSSLWLILVLVLFAAFGLWVASASNALDGFDLADRVSIVTTTDLATTAGIAGGGLFIIALLGGSLGGRLGETERLRSAERIVDIQEVESESADTRSEAEETQAETEETEAETVDAPAENPDARRDHDEVSA